MTLKGINVAGQFVVAQKKQNRLIVFTPAADSYHYGLADTLTLRVFKLLLG